MLDGVTLNSLGSGKEGVADGANEFRRRRQQRLRYRRRRRRVAAVGGAARGPLLLLLLLLLFVGMDDEMSLELGGRVEDLEKAPLLRC